MDAVPAEARSQGGWVDLWRHGNAARSALVGGGMVLHAVNVFIVATILPSVVHDIGGLQFFAWSTTLYVVASLFGAVACARMLRGCGARWTYRLALLLFALGSAGCALAPSMPVLLIGRFVQGLGAGTLSALSFTQVRQLFPQALWARALAVISVMWGAATLLGPAVGGVFAEYHAWRAAFWSLLAATPVLLLLVEWALPRGVPTPAAPRQSMAWLNLALLAGSVLAVSVGSMAQAAAANALGLAGAVAGFAWFVRREWRQLPTLLPTNATRLSAPLGATYAAMSLLLLGLSTEIFVPYFLQVLHGLSPLHAGYLSALLSAGWTLGSMASSGVTARSTAALLRCGPWAIAAGLLGLALLMPRAGVPGLDIVAMGGCLLAMGLGIGLCWPHLGTSVFGLADEGEQALAAASITTVVMVANAFGSALGGVLTNLAGLTAPGGVAGAAHAAGWLFGVATLAPLFAVAVMRRLDVVARPAAAA